MRDSVTWDAVVTAGIAYYLHDRDYTIARGIMRRAMGTSLRAAKLIRPLLDHEKSEEVFVETLNELIKL